MSIPKSLYNLVNMQSLVMLSLNPFIIFIYVPLTNFYPITTNFLAFCSNITLIS